MEEFSWWFHYKGPMKRADKVFLDAPSDACLSLLYMTGGAVAVLPPRSNEEQTMMALLSTFCRPYTTEKHGGGWVAFEPLECDSSPQFRPQDLLKMWEDDKTPLADELIEMQARVTQRVKFQEQATTMLRVDLSNDDWRAAAKQMLETALEDPELALFAVQEVLTNETNSRTRASLTVTHKNRRHAVWVRFPYRTKVRKKPGERVPRFRFDQVDIEAGLAALSGGEDITPGEKDCARSEMMAALGKDHPNSATRACRRLKLIVVKTLDADYSNSFKVGLNLKEYQVCRLNRFLKPVLGYYLFAGHRRKKKAALAYQSLPIKINFVDFETDDGDKDTIAAAVTKEEQK